MRMGLGERAGLELRGITCVLQTQFSSFSVISSLLFCSPIIHQFIPENSFDFIQIRVSSQSCNRAGVKIRHIDNL